MKRSRCPHDRLYRERGPQTRQWSPPLGVNEIKPEFEDAPTYEIPVVVEVCERCGRRREIGFMETMG